MKKKKNQYEREDFLDDDIYDDVFIEELLEDDEISSEEEGFMMGYNGSYG